MKKRKWIKKDILQSNLFLLIINLILIINVGVIFSKYVNSNQKEMLTISIEGIEEESSHISKQLNYYIQRQTEMTEGMASYMKEAQLTREDAVIYIEYIKSLDESLALIDCNTYSGYRVKNSMSHQSKKENVDYSDNEVIKALCQRIVSDDIKDTELHVTESFEQNGNGVSYVAFYQPVELEGSSMVLLCIKSIETIIGDALSEMVGEGKNGILIESSGKILAGKLLHATPTDKKVKNYYEYLEDSFGKEAKEQVLETLEEDKNGNFILVDNSGGYWVHAFSKVEGVEDWIYIYSERRMNMAMPGESKNAITTVILLMAAIGGTDVAIIFWQNQRLKKSLTELKNANEAKDFFISNMSHEIRTPINAVLGLDEMIIRESTEEPIIQYACDIKNAGKVLLGIINDILDFSKIESGKMEIIPAEYAVASVVNDLINMIDGRAKVRNLDFQVKVDEKMPHLLYGDELRIKQVILNLLTNAVKYTEKGSVTLSLDYEKIEEERISLWVKVKDTGIGLRPEEKDRLFKPFERLEEKRNRRIEGTGLGMSIVTNLLRQMGSSLEVESTYGEGSCFSFRLEQKVIDWKELGNLEEIYKESRSNEEGQGQILWAPKANVLVVDDTPMNLTVVKGLLKRTGMTVETAESGRECLEMAAKKKYQAILLDHRMPEMDGIETLHCLQQEEGPNRETPVIALTANAISGAYEIYKKEGFCDYLPKPIVGNRLERMLLKYLPKEIMEADETEPAQLDQEEGIKACGSEEIYQEVVKDFITTAETRISEIQDFCHAGDIENYTIKVHALKSTARFLGAQKLSEQAAYLEQCGNQGNIEEIEGKTEDLLTNCRDIGIKLNEIIKTDMDTNRPEMDKEQLKEALTAIREFNAAFDFDSVDAIMQSFLSYQIPLEAEETYEQLKIAVLDVDQEKIEQIIECYLGGTDSE